MHRLLVAARARRNVAIRATLCIALPLVGLVLAGHPQSAVIASQGGFAGFYAVDEPYRRRRAAVLGVGGALVVAMALGTVVAPAAWAAAVAGAVVAAGAAYVCLAYAVGPPREYFIVFTFLIGSGLPHDPGAAWSRAALVALGAGIALVVALAGHRKRTAAALAARAAGAVAALLRAVGTANAVAAQRRAVLAVQAAVRAAPDERALRLERMLEAAHGLVIEESPPIDPRWAELVESRGAAAESAGGESRRATLGALAVPPVPAGARLAEAVAGPGPDAPSLEPPPRRPWYGPLADALHPHSVVVGSALRMGVTVGVAGAIGLAVGGAHGYWLPLSAAAVLQATNVTLALRRATQRSLGTLVGVLLAATLLAVHPALGVLVAIVVLLQFVTESVIVASYGVAVVFITGLALLMLQIAHPESGVALLGARVADTVAGCALGALGGAFLWRDRAAKRLPAAQAELVRASATALGASLRVQDGLRHARHGVAAALSDLQTIQRDAGETGQWSLTPAVERLAYVALSLPPVDHQPGADELERALEELATAIETGQPPRGRIPALDGLPRTTAALEELRRSAASSSATSRPSRPA